MASHGQLKLDLLGGFALSQGDRQITIAASGQRLIALLALHDRPLARLRVAGTLWPEYSSRRALADLRTALWRVNQSGEAVVIASRSSLGLCESVEVDVRKLVRFTRSLNGRLFGLAEIEVEAVSLPELSRDLLPDWYEEWVLDEREALRQTRLHMLEALAAALSQAGRHADAIQAAVAAIRLEPLRETAHRTLIQAHIAEGNWSEARRQFQRCTTLFREELGVEPSPAMSRLFTYGLASSG